MIVLETILLILAYSLILVTIFLEIICYKRNMESLEMIFFTASLLLLIISLTVSPLLGHTDSIETSNVYVLLAMVLVGFTTPLNVMEERIHSIAPVWKKLLAITSSVLFISVIVGYTYNVLNVLQYFVVIFLGFLITLSMLLLMYTKPRKKIAHREKNERYFAIAFIIIIPLSLIGSYVFKSNDYSSSVGLTLPLIFILLAANKFLDDLQRLSLLQSNKNVKEQNLNNYALTNREKEIANLLVSGRTYQEISEQLYISMPTVKTHVSNIYKKCSVKSKSDLMLLLIQ